MAIATDDFNRADSESLGGNWTDQNGTIDIETQQAHNNDLAGAQDAYYSGTSFGADQYSQVTLSNDTFNVQLVTVRASGAGGTTSYYAIRTDGTSSGTLIRKVINAVSETLQVLNTTTTQGDVIKLEVVGNTLKAYKNDVQMGTDQASGGELTSGQPGIALGEGAAVDDWEGGDLAGPPPSDAVIPISTGRRPRYFAPGGTPR